MSTFISTLQVPSLSISSSDSGPVLEHVDSSRYSVAKINLCQQKLFEIGLCETVSILVLIQQMTRKQGIVLMG